MGTSNESGGSLDIIARGPDLSLFVQGQVRDAPDVILRGLITDASGEGLLSLPVTLVLDSRDFSDAPVEAIDNRLVFFGSQGEPVTSIVDYSARSVLGDRYELHSGLVLTEQGSRIDAIAVADPVPVVVVGGGILAAACLIGGGMAWLIEWLQTRSSGQAEACRRRGGFPKIAVEFKFSFAWRKRRIRMHCEATLPM